jgi:hypothetical protein
MTFTISLEPTTASPPHAQIENRARTVLSQGGAADADGFLHSADGVKFRFDDDSIQLDTLSPGMCRLIFEAAARTNTYISNIGSDLGPLKVKGAAGRAPPELGRAHVMATPAALCVVLNRRLDEWVRSEKQMQAEGVLGPNDELLQPPADPGTEVRVAIAASDVARQCDAAQRGMFAHVGWTIKTVVVSQSPKWGVVWRADVTTKQYPATLSRETCWSVSGPDGKPALRTSWRPLEMFNPAETVGPLKP